MSDTKNPFENQKIFEYAAGRGRVRYTPQIAWAFLQHILATRQLPIKSSLAPFDRRESFFLIAGTGLGKTLALPVYLWYRHMYFRRYYPEEAAGAVIGPERAPRIWVVEPKIAIVQDLHDELNAEWERWWLTKNASPPVPLFGCKTKVDQRNMQAPIMFVTIGIFAIYARKGIFRPGHDVVLMDEAHETLESDEAVELGIGICRASGVAIQYMSATVEVTQLPSLLGVTVINIPGMRQPIWRHNTRRPMEECIEELVRKALVEQDLRSEYFPKGTDEISARIIAAATEQNRAKGMLVIVNSFASEQSDAKRIARQLEQTSYANRIEIGLLASEVLRDPRRRTAYHQMLERWQREKKHYVLIATSVVEMGVTLPDLDFLVTMDSGFGDSNETGKLGRVTLGTNALIQRLGRVGRTRPGIAYITREMGAPYSELGDEALNAAGSLAPEPIVFPMSTGSLTWLAYETLVRGWGDTDLAAKVATLRLPTPMPGGSERYSQLRSERVRLWQLGVRFGNQGEIGVYLERWIGRAELGPAMMAQRAFEQWDAVGLVKALSRCALSVVPWAAVCPAGKGMPRREANRIAGKILWNLTILAFRWRQGCGLSAEYIRRDILENVWDLLLELGAREDIFLKFFAALIEAFEILGEANANQPVHRQKVDILFASREILRRLVSLPS